MSAAEVRLAVAVAAAVAIVAVAVTVTMTLARWAWRSIPRRVWCLTCGTEHHGTPRGNVAWALSHPCFTDQLSKSALPAGRGRTPRRASRPNLARPADGPRR